MPLKDIETKKVYMKEYRKTYLVPKLKMGCLFCGIEYFATKNHVKIGRSKYCSVKCLNKVRGQIGGKKGKGVSRNKGVKHPYLAEYNRTHIKKGVEATNWKGGITPINAVIRGSLEYKLWRKAVFERDNYTCVFCGKNKGDKHADHIKPFAYFPELRFAIDNGRTLCIPCHRKTDTYGRRGFKKST